MENLRWILIFAGVAILALLYFSGRSPKSGRGQSTRAGRATSRGLDARDASKTTGRILKYLVIRTRGTYPQETLKSI